MAENDLRNIGNPTITINVPGGSGAGTAPATENSPVIAMLAELLKQSGLTRDEITGLVSKLEGLSVSEDITAGNAALKKSISGSITAAKRAILEEIKKLEGSVVAGGTPSADDSAKLTKLQETLDRLEKATGKDSAQIAQLLANDASMSKELKSLVDAVAKIQKTLDDMQKTAGTTTGTSTDPAKKTGTSDTTGSSTTTDPAKKHDEATVTDPSAVTDPAKKGGSSTTTTDPSDTTDPAKKGDSTTTTTPVITGVAKPETPVITVTKPRYKKLVFVQKSLKQTKILAEPKQKWYKRLATFAVKHPVLSVVIGAGAGLGLFAATCGIASAAAGITFMNAVNMLIPSLPGIVGIGAAGAGAVSIASNTLPKGKWGLVAKAGKLFGKARKIDRTKQWVASMEQQQEAAKKASREKHKNSKGLVRKLKVHRKVAKVHKLAERTARKVRRLYERRLVKTTEKALKTKNQLNTKEIKSGKTQAIAGYLQKKRKAEAQFAAGKIDAEELDERLQDLDEDVVDRDGGEPGLREVGNQYTYDKEALEAIAKADPNAKNATFQAIADNILTRNSNATHSIKTKVVLDPEYLAEMIDEMKKKGDKEKAAEFQAQLDEIKRQAAESTAVAGASGVEGFEPLIDLTEEEIKAIEETGLDR